MASSPLLSEEEHSALRRFDTWMIANAIEKFNVRLRNTGFTDGKVRCMFPDAPPMVEYAVTGRLRSGDPPIAGDTLDCVGYVTNGAVRELPSLHRIGLQLFAGTVAVSHAYAHTLDIAIPVTVDRMEVRTGTLFHGDQHAVVTVPAEIAAEIPDVAAKLQRSEQEVIEFCQSERPVETLRALMKRTQ
jgi:hypothetical protein